jgi:hypothetical protein
MRDWTAHNGGVPLARPHQIVDILSAAAKQPKILDALYWAADESVDAFHEGRTRPDYRPPL